jgi:hypothetical protein
LTTQELKIGRKTRAMGLLGYVARALLILAGAFAGFAVISFASMGYTELALLFLAAIMIPVSMILYEYLTNPKK